MIELIHNDINAIIMQYSEKNSRVAFLFAMMIMLAAVGRFILKTNKVKKELVKKKSNNLENKQLGHRQIISVFVWFMLFFFFIYYFCFLIELTLLTREAGSRVDINLKFLGTWYPDIYSQCFMVENVLLFIPFGVFIVLLSERMGKLWKVIIVSFLFSLTIEVLQLLTGRGYFQVDDIWLNTVGGMIGACTGIVIKYFLKLIGIYQKIDKWFFVC